MNKPVEHIENHFVQLAQINVNEHVEKKANLAYLSWAWAVDQLMRADPAANWEFGEPRMFGESMMVYCTVTAFGKPITMHLPVMDHRNQAIKNPDAFAVNKNMMRCLVKAIACHGLGLYIYAGEDLPENIDDGNSAVKDKKTDQKKLDPRKLTESAIEDFITTINDAESMDALKKSFATAFRAAEHISDDDATKRFEQAKDKRKQQLQDEFTAHA